METHVRNISNPVTVTNQAGVKIAEFSHKAIMVQTMMSNETLRIRHQGNLYTTDIYGNLTKIGETSLGKALKAYSQ